MPVDWRGIARGHIGLLVSTAAGAVIVARLLLISGYNYETAVTLLVTQGTATVIFGSLLGVAYVLPTAFFMTLLFIAVREQYETGTVSAGVVVAYYVVGAIAVVTSPLVIAGTIALCMAFVTVEVVRAVREHADARTQREPGAVREDPDHYTRYAAARNIIALWAVVVGAQVLIAAPPWMPAERVQVGGDEGKDAIVGYVLENANDEIVVLKDSPREVVRLKNPDGFDRTYCETHDESWLQGGQPLITLLSPDVS